jgi:hypothetical protein
MDRAKTNNQPQKNSAICVTINGDPQNKAVISNFGYKTEHTDTQQQLGILGRGKTRRNETKRQ